MIVFAKTRMSVSKLLNRIQDAKPLQGVVKAAKMVGHSGADGMSGAKQDEVRKAFESGECNVLVATSVAEEGLNLPDCNLVIRFDAPSTVIALVTID